MSNVYNIRNSNEQPTLFGVVWVDESRGLSLGTVRAASEAEARGRALLVAGQTCHVFRHRQKSRSSGRRSGRG
jgi:hypothetical protein